MKQNIMNPIIKNKSLSSPVLVASGTFGYGQEYKDVHTYTRSKNKTENKLAAIICKTITVNPRSGNTPPRLKELKAANLNSIGLANDGIDYFVKKILPLFADYNCDIIVNIAGENEHEFCKIIHIIQNSPLEKYVWGWELNLSCPNVASGTSIGYNCTLITSLVKKVYKCTNKPIIAKLPPCIDRMADLGRAAEQGGADAISAINTVPAMWIDTQNKKAFFERPIVGLAGEAIFPIALALVYTLCKSVKIPVIAIGGITDPDKAIQFLLAGASAVQIGSANFKDPLLSIKCYDAIKKYFMCC